MGSLPPGKNHTEVVRLLNQHGLTSAYHAFYGETQGAESRPTHYFWHKKQRPFHIDYVFVPSSWRVNSVDVGSFARWGKVSDHVPVVVDAQA